MVKRLLLLCLLMILTPAEARLLSQVIPSQQGWLLVLEQEGRAAPDALQVTPLLRHFVVGRVSRSDIITAQRRFTRWQIPLSLPPGRAEPWPLIPPLRVGNEQSPSLSLPPLQGVTSAPAPAPRISQQAVLEEGERFWVGQPFVYRLTITLPETVERPGLDELHAAGFRVRRLGEDRWTPPPTPGQAGQIERRWLVQALQSGRFWLEAPRLSATLPAGEGQPAQQLSGRAAPLPVTIMATPPLPVAARLTLSQQIAPPAALHPGEPLIRTLRIDWQQGDMSALRLPAPQLPDLLVLPDGEQTHERYLASGQLVGQRTLRQAITAREPGEYRLPAIALRWFNTATGQIETARLPAMPFTVLAAPAQPASRHYGLLELVSLLLLIKGLRPWLIPCWDAARLYRALSDSPEQSRAAWRTWLRRRAQPPYPSLPEALAGAVDELERACFGPPVPWQPARLRRALRRHWRWLLTPTKAADTAREPG
ncbi:hypothetical protein ACET66_09680 [Aeromonas simiae]|uniref:hypothetical protein n=1 Tax=Aeromonas simiae TaxID=218936 RepID=UPI0038D06C1C